MNAYRVGFISTDDPTKIVVLNNGNTITAPNYQTLQDASTGANYQVPAGQTLYIARIIFTSGVSSATSYGQPGYGDTAVNNSASAPTNFRYLLDGKVLIASEIGYQTKTLDGCWPIPAQKYPCATFPTNQGVVLIGVLV